MKLRRSVFYSILIMLALSVFFAGCANPTTGKTGDEGPAGNGDTPFVLPYMIGTDFQYQVWGGSSAVMEVTDGVMRITKPAAAWSGGGLAVTMSGTTNTLDLTGATKLKFSIRGNTPATDVTVYIQVGGSDVASLKVKLSARGVTLDPTAWSNVEIDLSSASLTMVSNAFVFVIESSSSETWIELKGIDWVDGTGKSVNIAP